MKRLFWNELVFDYGANGDKSEDYADLTEEQKELVAMTWNLSNMDDEIINSYFPEFAKTLGDICMNCAYCGKCAIWVNVGDFGSCGNFTKKDGE